MTERAALTGPEQIDGDMTGADSADTLQRLRFRNGLLRS
jgi:hypothetical protein